MEINIEIREVLDNKKYCSEWQLFIGKLNVAAYGYNYSITKNEPGKYRAYSKIPFIKQTIWKFETIEAAKAHAYKIAEAVINGLQYKVKE